MEAVVTKDMALRILLHGACEAPKIGRKISLFSTSDLVWVENKGIFEPQEVKQISELPIWLLSGDGYGDGDGSGYGYGSGDGSGYGYGSGDGYGYGDGYE